MQNGSKCIFRQAISLSSPDVYPSWIIHLTEDLLHPLFPRINQIKITEIGRGVEFEDCRNQMQQGKVAGAGQNLF